MDGSESSRIDAVGELFEQYRLGRISRRTFVRGAVAVAGLVSVQALLAACAGEPGVNQSFSMCRAAQRRARSHPSEADLRGGPGRAHHRSLEP